MFIKTANDRRPYHLGRFPAETLPRDDAILAAEAARPALPEVETVVRPEGLLATAAHHYLEVYAGFRDEDAATEPAPVPDDRERRTADIKGSAYFLNAAHVGVCRIPELAWRRGRHAGHEFAVVLLVEHGRVPEPGNPAEAWFAPAVTDVAAMRAAEIATVVARQIRIMGFAATPQMLGHNDLDLERLAVLAGLALRDGERLIHPYLGQRFALAAISTSYELASDRPLAAGALRGARGLGYWLGQNGAESGRERRRRARRASHLGAYPMEQVKRVERPTTLILDDEVPRVPKRAAFFERALRGDLGPKAQRERRRFATKHPTSYGLARPIGALMAQQDGETKDVDTSGHGDAAANTRAMKSLSYALGADITGICEVPRHAWYSHKSDGTPIEPYHRYAVVMLIDQEFETMEGASGDDWISGAQSMRAYLRGAEIAGMMAELLRGLGFPARPQTSADSDVLQLPCILWAGLGEMSRIGELVLNPFLGPRSKSVILTTDMPLVPDKPIDIGLQYFCSHCWKCARECPCDAIPWGDKTVFNGYEIWRIDAERCARYRLTNTRGSACGRCMKTCPLNKVVTADGPLLTRVASWFGVNALWAKPFLVPIAVWLDDRFGNGRRNLIKKWWLDPEVTGKATVAAGGANERELDLDHTLDPAKQKIAIYPANVMPPGDHDAPFPVDRKAALAAAKEVETPDQARARRANGGAKPPQYVPPPNTG